LGRHLRGKVVDNRWFRLGPRLYHHSMVSTRTRGWNGRGTRDFPSDPAPPFRRVLVAGFLLGRPGHDASSRRSGSGSFWGQFALRQLRAAFSGALMYFATLTEIPIIQGLLGAGMGKGPALACSWLDPASPFLHVARGRTGRKKTPSMLARHGLSTVAGLGFG
jgi:hypothetical protein